MEAYDANGDMIARDGQRFRQVGWQVNGGVLDGELLTMKQTPAAPHGGVSPLYIEVGTD